MTGELAYHPDTGQLVYSPATGQLALDCILLNPCEDCDVEQPDAVVTINGACDVPCSDFAGTYAFCVYSDCMWCWCREGNLGPLTVEFYLVVYYKSDTKKWYAYIACAPGDGGCANQFCGGFGAYGDCSGSGPPGDIVDVECNPSTKYLINTFELIGQDAAIGVNCIGCTATVVLGGP